jgi:hypothetical protein
LAKAGHPRISFVAAATAAHHDQALPARMECSAVRSTNPDWAQVYDALI